MPPNQPDQPELTVTTVVTGNVDRIFACLDSLARGTSTPYRVIVVDNDASPGTMRRILRDHPETTVLRNGTRQSYAANQNRAIRECRTPFVLLLNDDTEVVGNAVDRLLAFLKDRMAGGPVAGVAPRLLNPDGSLQRSTFCFPTPLTVTATYLGIRPHVPYNRLTAFLARLLVGRRRSTRFWNHDETRVVDNVSGAAVLMDRRVIEQVGLMDERAPAYMEDTEWHLRLQKAGFDLWFCSDVEVIHHDKATNVRRESPEVMYKESVGLLNLFRVHFPGLRYAYTRALLVVTSLARAIPHCLAGLIVPQQRARGRSYLAITRFALSPKW